MLQQGAGTAGRGVAGAGGRGGGHVDPQTQKSIQAYAILNKFLQGFVDHVSVDARTMCVLYDICIYIYILDK